MSYATASGESELLLYLDRQCRGLHLWVNSAKRNNLDGVTVANLTHSTVCDGKWHHAIVSWDGVVGQTTAMVDGGVSEVHWSVFHGEKLSGGDGRVVLGHSQVHPPTPGRGTGVVGSGLVQEALLGQISDVFIINGTVSHTAADVVREHGVYEGIHEYVHWKMDNSVNSTDNDRILDHGSLGVWAQPFGGEFVAMPAGRPCDAK